MTPWDQRYLLGDTPWDKGRAHPVLATRPPRQSPARILVPGCGTGHDAIELARLHPESEIIGLDLSPTALATAARLAAGLPNLTWIQADALQWTPPEPCDLVWEHTFLCALDPSHRQDYAAACARWLRPGGLLEGVFFTHLDDEGCGPPWNTPPDELQHLLSPFFDGPLHATADHPTHPGRESEESYLCFTRIEK